MPTYEKVVDGELVERSVTFAGKDHDLQLSHAASLTDSPWYLVNEQGERVKPNAAPVFVEPPATPDIGTDTPPVSPTPEIESPQVAEPSAVDSTADPVDSPAEPVQPGDHTEE